MLLTSVSVAADVTPIKIGRQKQLFVDDYVIERMDNLTRTLNQPEKYRGNPVLLPDQPWEGFRAHMYGSVIYDREAGLFKMWYWAGTGATMGGCYATSKDGIHWDKPDLGIVEFEGSKHNNKTNWQAMGMIYQPDEPDPDKRYKSMWGTRGAFSADGLRWRVPPESKDIPGDIVSDNVVPFCYDEISTRYVAFGKVNRVSGGYERRSVSVSFSDDFLTWTPTQDILIPDSRDDAIARQTVASLKEHVEYDDGPKWHLAQFYGHCGFPYEGMYLGLLWVFDISGWGEVEWGDKNWVRTPGIGGEDGPMYVQLTSSRDLIKWQRAGDRKPFIPLGPVNSYDAGQIYTTNRPIVVGDEIWIYYAGQESTHGHPIDWATETDRFPNITEALKHASPRYRQTICLARLRLDGWVSVDAGSKQGTITTKPMLYDGGQLVINADARRGWVAAEVLDEDARAIPGFGIGDCQRFTVNSVRGRIGWSNGFGLETLVGRTIRLRFHLANAKLYAFGFK